MCLSFFNYQLVNISCICFLSISLCRQFYPPQEFSSRGSIVSSWLHDSYSRLSVLYLYCWLYLYLYLPSSFISSEHCFHLCTCGEVILTWCICTYLCLYLYLNFCHLIFLFVFVFAFLFYLYWALSPSGWPVEDIRTAEPPWELKHKNAQPGICNIATIVRKDKFMTWQILLKYAAHMWAKTGIQFKLTLWETCGIFCILKKNDQADLSN